MKKSELRQLIREEILKEAGGIGPIGQSKIDNKLGEVLTALGAWAAMLRQSDLSKTNPQYYKNAMKAADIARNALV